MLRTSWDDQTKVIRDGQADVSYVRLPDNQRGLQIQPLLTEPRVAALGTVIVVEPLVVEVEADASAETGILRRAARLHRAGPATQPTSWSRARGEADVTPSLLVQAVRVS